MWSTVVNDDGSGISANRLESGAQHGNEGSVGVPPDWARHSRLQLHELQKVPAIERQVFKLLALDEPAHLMVIEAEQRCGALNCHRLADVAWLERQIDLGVGSCLDAGRPLEAFEARGLRVDLRRRRCRHARRRSSA